VKRIVEGETLESNQIDGLYSLAMLDRFRADVQAAAQRRSVTK